jgi:hypothetical protein
MILDFKYTIDSLTNKLIEESGGLKKYLLPIIKNNRVADILSAFSIVLFDKFYNQKLLPKKNKYNIPESSTENLKNIIWDFGHNLTIGDFYTNSDEYLRRHARTLGKRISVKNTRRSYIYLYYIYGFKYNFSYKCNVISSSNRLVIIDEGTDNISIGASVYGEGIPENTFVIAKGDNYVDLSQNVRLITNSIGYGLIYSFYNEEIDVLINFSSPPESMETLKGKSISELVDIQNYYLDSDLKTPISINITNIINNIPEFQDLTFYSPYDSPRIVEISNNTYLQYEYLSLDENEPLYLVKPDGLIVTIPKADLKLWYLDYSNISQVTTRHFLLNYLMGSVESDSEFITKSSCVAFYNDVIQNKRLIEVPHFEPKLNLKFPVGTIPPNPLNVTKYPNLYTFTNSSGETKLQGRLNSVATMINIAFEDTLNEITHIQFGTSRRTDIDGSNLNVAINQTTMDLLLNDGINNRAVSQIFTNEDLNLNSIAFNSSNIYRFLNPLNFPAYRDLFADTTLPNLSGNDLTNNNNGVLSSEVPYYQLSLQNRWSFPIQYFKIEKLTDTQLILRNYLFPYFKWSSFSEIAFLRKNPNGNFSTIMYCTFPTINYSNEMLSSIYINIFLNYNFDEVTRKLSFVFNDTDWVLETGTNFYYLEIPYSDKLYEEYLNYAFEYIKPSDNDPTNDDYFFQNLGFNPYIYLYKRLTFNNELSGYDYEQIMPDSVLLYNNGKIKIRINNTTISPFTGKLILT